MWPFFTYISCIWQIKTNYALNVCRAQVKKKEHRMFKNNKN